MRSEVFKERLLLVVSAAMMLTSPVLFMWGTGHTPSQTMTTVMTVSWCAAIAYLVVLGTSVMAESMGRVLFAEGTGWFSFSMHWADWWRTRRTTITPEQARPFYALSWGRPQPRLRTVEALVAADAPPLSKSGVEYGFHYDLLRLLTAGLPPQTITALTGTAVMDERTVLDLFDLVPDLTPGDLTRFVQGGLPDDTGLTGDTAPAARHRILRDWYALYGPRASYFYALGFSHAEAKRAMAEGTPIETLAAMTGLLHTA